MRFVVRFRPQGVASLAGAVFMAAYSVACSKPADTTPKAETPARTGVALVTFPVKYTDSAPSLNADGTKVIFTSGRDSTDSESLLKIYKVDWPAGGAPGAPTRLTGGADIGAEQAAAISLSGAYTGVISAKYSQVDLFLQGYASGSPVQITNDGAIESRPRFSPDSKLLAFISRDSAAATSKLQAVTVGAGAAADVATVATLSVDAEFVIDFAWLANSGANYTLAVVIQGADGTGATIERISFAAPADAAAAARTALATDVPLDLEAGISAAGTEISGVRQVLPEGSKFSVALGGGDTPPPRQTPVTSEVFFLDSGAAAGTKPASFAAPSGHVAEDNGGMFSDASNTFLTMLQAYRCDPKAPTFLFASAMMAVPTDAKTGPVIYVPRTNKDATGFEVAGDYCDVKRADASVGHIDAQVSGAVVNGGATSTKLRALYISRFTPHFDASCNLKIGDPEIYGLSIDGETKTIAPVSANAATIVDDDRGGKTACSL